MKETKAQIMADAGPHERAHIIANNTVEYHRANGDRVVRLHHTNIITECARNGALVLNSGSWQSVTTKERLNRYLDSHGPTRYGSIYSIDSLWFINWHGKEYPFTDGVTLYPNGRVTHAGNHRNLKKLKAQINAFCKKVEALDELPKPSSGDCWFCSIFNQRPPVTDHAARDNWAVTDPIPGSMDRHPGCLIKHIRESYVHGSLIVNAMRWAGYGDIAIEYAYERQNHWRANVTRALQRYLKRQLGLPA